jgi:uncharacterized membrane protein YebE (DUF533 family)
MRDRIEELGRILVAAAHADGHVEPQEVEKIREVLESICDPLPEGLLERILAFDPVTTPLLDLAAPFSPDAAPEKRRLLELIVSVHDADGETDYLEDTFVRETGRALGLDPDAYEDLLLQILPATPEEEAEPAPAKKPAAKPTAKKKPTAKPTAKKKPTAKPKAKKKPAPKAKKPAAKPKAKKKPRKR